MTQGNKQVAHVSDKCDGFVAMTAAPHEGVAVQGRYVGTLMRVVPEYEQEALQLSAELVAAEERRAEQEVARLVARLQALPRYEAWTDVIDNIVTTVGRNDMLDKYLAGSAWTTTIFMGLKGTGAAAAGDTQASHATWLEVGLANAPAYSGNRPVPSLSAASGGVKQTSSAVSFTFTSGGTVAGCFINIAGSATKDNTTGILFSAGDFTGGSKTVANTDVLNVTWQLTATSS